jgi:hypothetical protein
VEDGSDEDGPDRGPSRSRIPLRGLRGVRARARLSPAVPVRGAASSDRRRACCAAAGASRGERRDARGPRWSRRRRVRRDGSERADRVQAGARRPRRLGRGRDVRHDLGSLFVRGRRRLPALRHRGALDLQRFDGLRLGLRLLVGLGAVPLRSLGLPRRQRLVVDPGPSLRRRLGHLAHGSCGLRLRRLGACSALLVLVPRLTVRLVVRWIPPLRPLRVLST